MSRLIIFAFIAVGFVHIAEAQPVRRDPRQTMLHSAGQGAGAGRQTVSFVNAPNPEDRGAGGVNLVTEMPLILQQQFETELAAEEALLAMPLPVRVASRELEMMIRTGDIEGSGGVDMDTLTMCAAVNPGAMIAWDRPTYRGVRGGVGIEQYTCVMEVELVGMLGTQQLVLARMNVPANSSFVCNLESFPPEGFLPAIERVELPPDREPTMDDVRSAMDRERRRGGGMRTVTGVIGGALMGNIMGAPAAGDEGKFISGGRDRIITTVAGAAVGGGAMYATGQVGHTAGVAMESALISGAGGAVLGNMAAGAFGSGSTLAIRKCTVLNQDGEFNCLMGVVSKGDTEHSARCRVDEGNFRTSCWVANEENGPWTRRNCRNFKSKEGCVNVATSTFETGKCSNAEKFNAAENPNARMPDGVYLEGTCMAGGTETRLVMTIDKTSATLKDFKDNCKTWVRDIWNVNSLGNGTTLFSELTREQCGTIEPFIKEAADGGIVDFNNRARLGGTVTGAGMGAGVGAFAGYQRAEQEVADRYFAAVQEYADVLRKFHCRSGNADGTINRYLGQYNETVIVPAMIMP
ncbi:MAG: hypothetical protein FWD33_03090 [Alphaproteobacteria bacterium]|nr:hypothetical protein [Alphaproteobacteria bacterium]